VTDSNQENKSQSSESAASEEHFNGMPKNQYMKFRPLVPERNRPSSMEVIVDHGVERAMKVLKRKLIKEGLFKELKARRYYQKPSEEKKRRLKESLKKIRKEESRRQKNQVLF